MPRIHLPRERADDLANAALLEEEGEPEIRVAGVVVDDREVARAAADQRVDELRRLPRGAEAADHDGHAVGDVGERRVRRGDPLVDHFPCFSGMFFDTE